MSRLKYCVIVILLSILSLIKGDFSIVTNNCRSYYLDSNSNDTLSYACLLGPFFIDCDRVINADDGQKVFTCEDLQTNSVCYGTGNFIDDLCGPLPPICTRTGLFPIPDSRRCQNFYTCTPLGAGTFKQSIEKCVDGFEFSATENRCMEVNEAGCSIPITTTASTSTTTKATTGTNPPIPTTLSPITINCKGLGFLGRIADPLNCRKYYQCVNMGLFYVTRHIECPFNLKYDDNRNMCSISASCGNRPLY